MRTAFKRPFPSVEYMNNVLVSACNFYAGESDLVVHVGDLLTYGKDRGDNAPRQNPSEFLSRINSTFVNIEGNHDAKNKVKSIATSIRTTLGPFIDVSVSHYPSYNPAAAGTFLPGDIHLCGHVHNAWKHYMDEKNKVLNINVGVDVWGFRPVSEDTLIAYIRGIFGIKGHADLQSLVKESEKHV